MSFFENHYLAITIGEVEIDLSRAKDTKTSTPTDKKYNEVVVLQPAPNEQLVLDKDTVSNFSQTLGNIYPSGFTIDIKDVSLAIYDKDKNGNKGMVAAANFSLDIDVSDLPLVGHMFPKDLTFALQNIQVLFSTQAIANSTELTNRLPPDIPAFPKDIVKGVNFSASFDVGNELITVGTGSMQQWESAAKGTSANANNTPGGSKNSQGNVNKKFGPVFIQSVGLDFVNNDLNVVITGSIKLGPLTVSLDKLSIGSPLSDFQPEASLKGLSVDYKKNQVNIGGGLVREKLGDLEVYNGALAVDLTKFQMSALGSYANDHGNPSLFVFAQLNEPLGGPSFFFVTGLAFTFGINRNLIKPQVQDVSTFPLIKAATGSIAPPSAGATSLIPAGMNTYLPPQVGEYFLGVGVKFTSFKVINSFALFIVKFGKELEFDLLGVSTYIAPNPKDPNPVATVELEIVGSYKPSTGDLLIRGMLTPNSFVLSKQCHLQGGFAIACWTDPSSHSGEFVFTFGGYGNHYTPQPYYPQGIPELGFLWQINSNISIKGGGYWTITPHRVLAGGFLKAVADLGWVRASFNLNAFFEIDWSPFHYEGEFSVEFSLEVHVDFLFFSCWLGFTIGEGLSIHGPDFGGTAHISLYVCTVNVSFGAAPTPKPLLNWNKFLTSFTPLKEIAASSNTPAHTTGMVKINLTSGLVKEYKSTAENIAQINAKDLCLSVSTFMPNSAFEFGAFGTAFNAINAGEGHHFGIKPMGVASPKPTVPTASPFSVSDPGQGDYQTRLQISVYPSGKPFSEQDNQFKGEPVMGNVPRAIWGSAADAEGDTVIPALTGVVITPATPPKASATEPVDRSILAWEDEYEANSFDWSPFQENFSSTQQTGTGYTLGTSNSDKGSILGALGFAQTDIPDDSGLQKRIKHTSGFWAGTYNNEQS